MTATRFVHPMRHTGQYPSSWAGYVFKEALGYTSGRHTGVDYNYGGGNDDHGFPCFSIAEGVVKYVGNLSSSGYGNTIIVEHELPAVWAHELGTSHLYSRYMHLSAINVSVGQAVGVGQQIGLVGNTGTVLAHLHIDLWRGSLGVHLRYDKDTELASYLDPYQFIETHQQATEGGATVDTIKSMYLRLLGREADQDGIDTYSRAASERGFEFVYNDLKNSTEGQADWDRRSPQRVAELERRVAGADQLQQQVNALSSQLTDVQAALRDAQDKPPVEVIKEVERIVEKPVEVPVYVHDEQLRKDVSSIRMMLVNFVGYVKNKLGR